jgi:hypothetical protein
MWATPIPGRIPPRLGCLEWCQLPHNILMLTMTTFHLICRIEARIDPLDPDLGGSHRV